MSSTMRETDPRHGVGPILAQPEVVAELVTQPVAEDEPVLDEPPLIVAAEPAGPTRFALAAARVGISWSRVSAPAVRWVNAALVFAMTLSAFFGNEFRSQDYDPMYMRDLVERQMHYGGSYYVNGIHNKGPLEPIVYRLAATFTSWNSYWFAISAFIFLAACFLAWCAARVFRTTSGHQSLGFAVGLAVLIHFTLSGSDYGGVLYSRNMTVCLLAAALMILIDRAVWDGRRRLRPTGAAVIVGCLLGLTMQTLTTAALSAGVLGLSGLWLMADGSERIERIERRRRFFLMGGSAVLTFALAPAWYVARGMGGTFWNSWWVFGTYMTRATSRSLSQQLGLGWHQFYGYYQQRPMALAVIAAFGAFVVGQWRESTPRARAYGAALFGWWFAACVEITLTQRYSSHYFVVTTVPTIFMAAALFGALVRKLFTIEARSKRASIAALATIVGSLFFGNPISFVNGLRAASAFHGFDDYAARREQAADGSTQSVRAVLDIVSRPDDPLLMWTNVPWSYLTFHRVSATRFIWKSFLMGEIYLGRTSPDYVLPGSWEQWRADLRQSRPIAFVENVNGLMNAGTEADQYVRQEFSTVYRDPQNRVDLRNDVFAALVTTPPSTTTGATPWVTPGIPGGSGWSATVGSAHFTRTSAAPNDDPLFIGGHGCFRLDGVMTSTAGRRGAIAFRFDDPTGRHERRRLAIEDAFVASGSDAVGFGQSPLTTPQTSSLPFALIVGKESAAIVTEGHVGAAVRLQGPVSVSLESHGDAVSLDRLVLRPGPTPAGCP